MNAEICDIGRFSNPESWCIMLGLCLGFISQVKSFMGKETWRGDAWRLSGFS
jgi:hypothetical protein